MSYTIEHVKPGDEVALASIHTESWKAGFRDILSADALQRCTQMDAVTDMYLHLIGQRYGHGYLLRVDGKPHCIAWWNATREDDMPGYAELICLHSLPGQWRQGYGRKMMDTVLRDMTDAGYQHVMLWVFEENERARRFYEALGFTPDGKTKNDSGAVEVCYEKNLSDTRS